MTRMRSGARVLVAVFASAGAAWLAVPAGAQTNDYTNTSNPSVLPTQVTRGGVGPTGAVRGESESRGLPVTGGDIVALTLVGGGAVAAGTVLVRRSRTRSTVA